MSAFRLTYVNFISIIVSFFKVRVDLLETEHVCSAASKRGRYRQEVKVGSRTTRSVPFIIIPMKDREISIEVKAAVKDSGLTDGIRKMLRVVVRERIHVAGLERGIPHFVVLLLQC